MLVLLGADVIRRLRRDRIRLDVHGHQDGTRHFHAHSGHDESTHAPHEVIAVPSWLSGSRLNRFHTALQF